MISRTPVASTTPSNSILGCGAGCCSCLSELLESLLRLSCLLCSRLNCLRCWSCCGFCPSSGVSAGTSASSALTGSALTGSAFWAACIRALFCLFFLDSLLWAGFCTFADADSGAAFSCAVSFDAEASDAVGTDSGAVSATGAEFDAAVTAASAASEAGFTSCFDLRLRLRPLPSADTPSDGFSAFSGSDSNNSTTTASSFLGLSAAVGFTSSFFGRPLLFFS